MVRKKRLGDLLREEVTKSTEAEASAASTESSRSPLPPLEAIPKGVTPEAVVPEIIASETVIPEDTVKTVIPEIVSPAVLLDLPASDTSPRKPPQSQAPSGVDPRLQEQEYAIAQLQNALTDAEAATAAANKKIQEQGHGISQLQQELAASQKEKAKLVNQLDQQLQVSQTLQGEMERQKTLIQQLQLEVSKMVDLKNEVEQARSVILQLTELNAQLTAAAKAAPKTPSSSLAPMTHQPKAIRSESLSYPRKLPHHSIQTQPKPAPKPIPGRLSDADIGWVD